ncbi:uncharacterized protein LOC115236000 [Formica exsecta]|uniref:uncharacterized protein LOC115236000 n=1 Tax=Formica exsecta TaxID=72781 RepID=UPI00114429CE|nr:uncharacterized protein LOC115236000 [Formica exsecta]
MGGSERESAQKRTRHACRGGLRLRSPGSYSGTVALTTRIHACAYATLTVRDVNDGQRVARASFVRHPWYHRIVSTTIAFTATTIAGHHHHRCHHPRLDASKRSWIGWCFGSRDRGQSGDDPNRSVAKDGSTASSSASLHLKRLETLDSFPKIRIPISRAVGYHGYGASGGGRRLDGAARIDPRQDDDTGAGAGAATLLRLTVAATTDGRECVLLARRCRRGRHGGRPASHQDASKPPHRPPLRST